MANFLPSEIARLVLGYLEQQRCFSAYDEFLNTNPFLAECRGREFTCNLMGYTLECILREYCLIKSYVSRLSITNLKENLDLCCSLPDKVKLMVNVIIQAQSSSASKQRADTPVRTRTKSVDSSEPSLRLPQAIMPITHYHAYSSESILEATKLQNLPGTRGVWQCERKNDQKSTSVSCSLPNISANDKSSTDNVLKTPISKDPRLKKTRLSADSSDVRFNRNERDGTFPGLQTPNKPNRISPAMLSSMSKSIEILPSDLNVSVKTNELLNYSDMHSEKIGDIDKLLEVSENQILNDNNLDYGDTPIVKDWNCYTNASTGNTPEELKNDFKELFATAITSHNQIKVSRPESSTPDKRHSSRVHEDSVSKGIITKMRVMPKKNLSPHRFKRNMQSTTYTDSTSKRFEHNVIEDAKQQSQFKKCVAIPNQCEFDSNLQGQVDICTKNENLKRNTNVKNDKIEAKGKNVIILSNEKICTGVTSDNKIIISKAPEIQPDIENKNNQIENKKSNNQNINTICVETNTGLNSNFETYIVAAKTHNVIYNNHKNETIPERNDSRTINVPLIPIENQSYYNVSEIQEELSNDNHIIAGKYSDFIMPDGKFQILTVGSSTSVDLSVSDCQGFTEQQILTMPTLIMVQSNSNQINLQDFSEHAGQSQCANELNHIYTNSSSQNVNNNDGGVSIIETEQSEHTAPVHMICSNLVAVPVNPFASSYCGVNIESQETVNKTTGKLENYAESNLISKGTPDMKVDKEQSSSTPRRKNSHIRVLDFSTPKKPSLSPRRAYTLPKMPFKNERSPSTKVMLKNKKVHSKLFESVSAQSEFTNCIEKDTIVCTGNTKKKKTIPKKTKSIMPITEETVIDRINLNRASLWDAKLRSLVSPVIHVTHAKKNINKKTKNLNVGKVCKINDGESSSTIKIKKPSSSKSLDNVPYKGEDCNKSSLNKTKDSSTQFSSQSIENIPCKGDDIKTTETMCTPSQSSVNEHCTSEKNKISSIKMGKIISTPSSSQSIANVHYEEEDCKPLISNRTSSIINTANKKTTQLFQCVSNVSGEHKDVSGEHKDDITINCKTSTKIRTPKKVSTPTFQSIPNVSRISKDCRTPSIRTARKISPSSSQSIVNISKSKDHKSLNRTSSNAKIKIKTATPRKSQRLKKNKKDIHLKSSNEKDGCRMCEGGSLKLQQKELNDKGKKKYSPNDSIESESLDNSLEHNGKLLEDALIQNDSEQNEECYINEANLSYSVENENKAVNKTDESEKFVTKESREESKPNAEQSICNITSRSIENLKKSAKVLISNSKTESNFNVSSYLSNNDHIVCGNSNNISHPLDDSNHNMKFDESNNFRESTGKKPSFSKDNTKIIEQGKPIIISNKITSIEPPVPRIKITPDMPRGTCSNPLNVKCNLSALLVTPMKSAMMDIPLPTPKFVSPSHENDPISAIKILNIPTPSFLVTPKHTSVISTTKKISPNSYTSRPTDYSSSSSYYKPDEGDDIFFNAVLDDHIEDKSKSVDFSNIKLKKEAKEKLASMPKISRPVRQCTIKAKIKRDIEKEDKDNHSDFSSSYTSLSSSSSDVSSDTSTSPSPPTNNMKAKDKENSKNNLFKKENHPLSSLVNNTALELERKRLRVLSKLRKTSKTCKSIKTAKVTKNIERKRGESPTDVKNRTLESPKTITKLMIKDDGAQIQGDYVNQRKSCEVIHSPMKSRRKSATPRKLETVKFYDEHIITSKVMYYKQETNLPHVHTEKKISQSIDSSSLSKLSNADNNQPSKSSTDSNIIIISSHDATENENNTSRVSKNPADDKNNDLSDSYDINAIKEYINNSSTQCSISPIKRNTVEDSFDSISAKQIEIQLSDPGVTKLQTNAQKLIEGKASNFNDKKSDLIPKELDTRAESSESCEYFEWSVSDCDVESSNFINHSHRNVSKKTTILVPLDESYSANFSVFNTVKDVDELRSMSLTPLTFLFDSPCKKGKLFHKNKRSYKSEGLSKKKITIPELKKTFADDSPGQIREKEASEIIMAVQSILPTNTDYSWDSHNNDTNQAVFNSDNLNISVEGDTESHDSNEIDLLNMSNEVKPSGSVGIAKRRRSSDENCPPNKRSKSIDPQSLLKGMNIDDLLSKIHGPE